jgi:hypothetical protein
MHLAAFIRVYAAQIMMVADAPRVNPVAKIRYYFGVMQILHNGLQKNH